MHQGDIRYGDKIELVGNSVNNLHLLLLKTIHFHHGGSSQCQKTKNGQLPFSACRKGWAEVFVVYESISGVFKKQSETNIGFRLWLTRNSWVNADTYIIGRKRSKSSV